MGKSFSNDDHDPGDEDPTERVKRALLEVLEDEPLIVEVPPRHAMSTSVPLIYGRCRVNSPPHPDATNPADVLAEILGLGRR